MAGGLTAGGLVARAALIAAARAGDELGWEVEQRASQILAGISEPSFPPAQFDVTDYGAVADGSTDNAEAFSSAIADCAIAGGGTVLVPAGPDAYFIRGPVVLTGDSQRLHLQGGATLRFSHPDASNPYADEYPVLADTGELMPLISAEGRTNVGVTGEGAASVIDGQAAAVPYNWWSWTGRPEHGWQEGVPIEGQDVAKRPTTVYFSQCRNVVVRGLRTVDTPKFQFKLRGCQNVTVDGLYAQSGGPNNDGIDPSSCRYVVIQNCRIDSGDDCVAVAAGAGLCSDILMQDCDLYRGHAALACGSSASGGIRNVVARRIHMHDSDLWYALRVKLNRQTGGSVEDVFFYDGDSVGLKKSAMEVNLHYSTEQGELLPRVRNVHVGRLRVGSGSRSDYALYVNGWPDACVHSVELADSSIARARTPKLANYIDGLTVDNTTVNGLPLDSGIDIPCGGAPAVRAGPSVSP